jgi:beta-glucosidase
VAELYLTFPKLAGAPVRALRGFARVHLAAGASQALHFDLNVRDLSMVSEAGDRIMAPGDYQVTVGGGQPGTGVSTVEATFTVDGTMTLAE